MDRSRVGTINLAYSISHEPVSKQIYLTQYGLMAERHWREFRPKMVRELEALFEAQERVATIMEQTPSQKQYRENRAVVLTR
jgi:hypothetical protein